MKTTPRQPEDKAPGQVPPPGVGNVPSTLQPGGQIVEPARPDSHEKRQENKVADEASIESFPASDPPAHTGTRA
jgi:hypothetical protein